MLEQIQSLRPEKVEPVEIKFFLMFSRSVSLFALSAGHSRLSFVSLQLPTPNFQCARDCYKVKVKVKAYFERGENLYENMKPNKILKCWLKIENLKKSLEFVECKKESEFIPVPIAYLIQFNCAHLFFWFFQTVTIVTRVTK